MTRTDTIHRGERSTARALAFADGRSRRGRALPLASERHQLYSPLIGHAPLIGAALPFDGERFESDDDISGLVWVRSQSPRRRAVTGQPHLVGEAIADRRSQTLFAGPGGTPGPRRGTALTESERESESRRVAAERRGPLVRPVARVTTTTTTTTRPTRPTRPTGPTGPTNRVADESRADGIHAEGALAVAVGRRPLRREPFDAADHGDRTELRVIEPGARRWSVGAWIGFGFVVLALVLFAAVALHASLAQRQVKLDARNAEVVAAESVYDRLRVEVARLESPARIAGEAARLGLRSPDSVRFVNPNATGDGGLTVVEAPVP